MEYSSFWNSIMGADGSWDRPTKAEDFDRHFMGLLTNGVFPNPSTNLQVTANGTAMTVSVDAGPAWIQNKHYFNDTALPLTIDTADAATARIDRVVIRLDYDNRKIYAAVKKGTYAQTPVAPVLQRDADIYEIAIADIAVVAGTSAIHQADITDQRLNSAVCGIVNFCSPWDTTAIFNQMQSWLNDQKTSMTEQEQLWAAAFTSWFDTIKGQLGTDVAGSLQNQINNNKSVSISATLAAANWSGSSATYTQSLAVTGLGATQNGDISVAQSATTEQRVAAIKAKLSVTGQAAGQLTITADGTKPAVDIPVNVILMG